MHRGKQFRRCAERVGGSWTVDLKMNPGLGAAGLWDGLGFRSLLLRLPKKKLEQLLAKYCTRNLQIPSMRTCSASREMMLFLHRRSSRLSLGNRAGLHGLPVAGSGVFKFRPDTLIRVPDRMAIPGSLSSAMGVIMMRGVLMGGICIRGTLSSARFHAASNFAHHSSRA